MPPKNARKAAARKKLRKEEQGSDIEDELPPEKPPRPFREIDALPMSIEEPDYNILGQPLSMKDSAVLYSSLMKSRKAYHTSNVFDLYWAKGKTKFENDINARDRMNKLCDCEMEIGPHSYDVRFFILKDDEIEKKREEIKTKKKERRLANKQMREEKKKVRDMKNQEAEAANANTSTTTPTGDAQPGNSNPTNEPNPGPKNDEDDDDDNSDDSDSDNDKEEQSREASSTAPKGEVKPSLTQQQAEPSTTTVVVPSPEGNAIKTPVPPAQPSTTTKSDLKKPEDTEPAPEPPKAKPLPPLHNSSAQSSSQQATPTPPAQRPPPSQQQQQSANDMMQSPESQMMIANLNAIARVDPSLNTLMKIVASGSASSAQIREFQGYIQRAKAMGPTPHFRQQFPNYQPQRTPKPAKPEKKAKPPREKQLTTFQEMYVNGADLVFEFSENPNVRFNLPKDCIVEKTETGEFIISFLVIYNMEQIKKWKTRQQNKKEKAEKAKELAEKKKAEKEEAEKKTEQKKLEDEEKKVQEEGKAGESRASRRRTRGVDKKGDTEMAEVDEGKKLEEQAKEEEAKKKKEKEKALKDEDPEPIPYFMPISFKITNLDRKYDPIFLNSFNPKDEVYKMMERVLKDGTRAPKYLLWYQVDAYDDENLAENLREQLFLIENPPKKYKKRNTEENPLMSKPKRQRKEKSTPVKPEAAAEVTVS